MLTNFRNKFASALLGIWGSHGGLYIRFGWTGGVRRRRRRGVIAEKARGIPKKGWGFRLFAALPFRNGFVRFGGE